MRQSRGTLKHLRVRDARRHVTHVCSATIRPRRLRRERLTRDPDDATPGERRQAVDRGLWWSRPWGQRVLRESRSRRDSQRNRAQKKVWVDTDCTRGSSLNHTKSNPPRTELSTERLVCNKSHWPTVVRSRVSNAGLSAPLVHRCSVRTPTVLSCFQQHLACRLSSLRRLLVSFLDDGEDA